MQETDIYLHPAHIRHLDKIARRIFTVASSMCVTFSYCGEPLSFAEIDKNSYKPLHKGQVWARKKFDTAWLQLRGEKPTITSDPNFEVVAIIDICGEGMVYSDGKILTSITSNPNKNTKFQYIRGKALVPLSSLPENFTLDIDASFNGIVQAGEAFATLRRADIAIMDKRYNEFYYNYQTLSIAAISMKNSAESKKINAVLSKAMQALDNPEKAIEILNSAYVEKTSEKLRYYAVGHGHLDLAWLWPLRESHRKARRTLAAQLQNIEACPDFVYGISQPQQLEWVKTEAPDLFEKVKVAVKNGNIEPQGGMWVECDCNLVSGESLIRQFHYGTEFWEKEFGKTVTTCWLPDVFGFSGSLPQIIKGCGMKSFMTIKLTWNNVNNFPFRSFNWVGIDGTKLLSHIPPEGDYTTTASPIVAKRGIAKYPEVSVAPVALIAYGVGDGGCGPSECHVETVKHQKNIAGMPSVKFSSAEAFFDELEKYSDRLPEYRGELYLEKHQGTFTTQSNSKKYNRKLEIKLHNVEFLLSQAIVKGKDISEFSLDGIWKEILLYQFHDILPGSSITRVYTESVARYKIIDAELDEMIKKLAVLLDAHTGFFNASPVKRLGTMELDNGCYQYYAKPYGNVTLEDESDQSLEMDRNLLQNSRLRLEFNGRGEIISCYDKLNKFEFCSTVLNRLVMYSDPITAFNAWDISPKYQRLPHTRLWLLSSKFGQTDACVYVENKYRTLFSKIKQKVVLNANSQIITFETEVDWHESSQMLRADFYPQCFGNTVKCDTQFGVKEYSTIERNSIEKAKFEINAHKFVDTVKDGFGFALLNDCKYGHRVKNGKISLNLLRSTVNPDPKADRGHHSFTYAIYPHRGDMYDSSVQNAAYALNHDFLPFSFDHEQIILMENPNIIVETIKPSFDGSGIAVRLYDKTGRTQKSEMYIPKGYSVYACDMLEKNLEPASTLAVLKGFGIQTYILKKD